MAEFEAKDGVLLIDDREVLRGWESINGWYWFGLEAVREQDSVIDGRTYEGDRIWFGYVQGMSEEYGNFSQTELELMAPRVWEIPRESLPYSGRR